MSESYEDHVTTSDEHEAEDMVIADRTSLGTYTDSPQNSDELSAGDCIFFLNSLDPMDLRKDFNSEEVEVSSVDMEVPSYQYVLKDSLDVEVRVEGSWYLVVQNGGEIWLTDEHPAYELRPDDGEIEISCYGIAYQLTLDRDSRLSGVFCRAKDQNGEYVKKYYSRHEVNGSISISPANVAPGTACFYLFTPCIEFSENLVVHDYEVKRLLVGNRNPICLLPTSGDNLATYEISQCIHQSDSGTLIYVVYPLVATDTLELQREEERTAVMSDIYKKFIIKCFPVDKCRTYGDNFYREMAAYNHSSSIHENDVLMRQESVINIVKERFRIFVLPVVCNYGCINDNFNIGSTNDSLVPLRNTYADISFEEGDQERWALMRMHDILLAVYKFHGGNMGHREISLKNFLWYSRVGTTRRSTDGTVLCDYGKAVNLPSISSECVPSVLTAAEWIYRSPEEIDEPNQWINPKSVDMWRLGVVFSHLLTNYAPFYSYESKLDDSWEAVGDVLGGSWAVNNDTYMKNNIDSLDIPDDKKEFLCRDTDVYTRALLFGLIARCDDRMSIENAICVFNANPRVSVKIPVHI
mmetsp:Transcript_19587/g.28173  ORF Transcript_19587/g.28173 Transcript_19587/m.28173 type:complete len:580 (-) Transcript_19587:189-1928(-)